MIWHGHVDVGGQSEVHRVENCVPLCESPDFETFTAAKRYVVQQLVNERKEIANQLYWIRRLRKEDA